jgi:hypothetical protein
LLEHAGQAREWANSLLTDLEQFDSEVAKAPVGVLTQCPAAMLIELALGFWILGVPLASPAALTYFVPQQL